MTYQIALPYHREHTQQNIAVQCHELFSWRLSYDRGRASSGRFLFALSFFCCNDDSLHSPGSAFLSCSRTSADHSLVAPLPIASTLSLPMRRGGRLWRFHRSREVGDVGNS
jgi:hypothetical protein